MRIILLPGKLEIEVEGGVVSKIEQTTDGYPQVNLAFMIRVFSQFDFNLNRFGFTAAVDGQADLVTWIEASYSLYK